MVNEYFEWLSSLVCGNKNSEYVSYRKLLMQLHNTDFRYIMPMDQNQEIHGIELRRKFALRLGLRDTPECLDGPCSVLEMMISLAVRCEETIMDNPRIGDRTGQWFWDMVVNLGLGSMTDDHYDKRYVIDVIDRFLDREYEPNGRGGLFTIRGCDRDLRRVEIWHQTCWYLGSIM